MEIILPLIFVGVIGGIWAVWKFLQWLAHSAEKEIIQVKIEKMRRDPLFLKTMIKSPWLEDYIFCFDWDGNKILRHGNLSSTTDIIEKAKKKFENDYEKLVEEKFWDIANRMEKYINAPFLTLQDIHDKVLECSKDGMKLPDYMNDAAAKRYLAIKQIDIRLKLQKLEEVGVLEKHEKMERGKLMDKLDKTFEIWERNGQKEEKRKEEAKKPRTKNEETKKLDIIHHIWENNDKEEND